jgi:hypothetical protein
MPSWVDCCLEVTGPKDEIELFAGMACGEGDRNYLEFNDLYSVPADLNLEKNSATNLIYKAKYGDEDTVNNLLILDWIKSKASNRQELIKFAVDRDPECEEAAEKYKANFDKYGFTTWKDWCIENWGTKWSAQQTRLTSSIVPGIKSMMTLYYHFNTIWSPPVPLVKVVGRNYDKLEFLLEYKNTIENYRGRLLVRYGQIVQDDRKELEAVSEVSRVEI